MKDKELRKAFRYDEYSNRTFYLPQIERNDNRITDLHQRMNIIHKKLDLLAEVIGLQFKYQQDYPEIELVEDYDVHD